MKIIEGPSVHATRMVKVLGIFWKLMNPLNAEGKWNNFFILSVIVHAYFVVATTSYLLFSENLSPIELMENVAYSLQIFRHLGYLAIVYLLQARIQKAMDMIAKERLQLRSTDDEWSLSIDYMKKEFRISVVSAVVMSFEACSFTFLPFLFDNVNDYQLPYNFCFIYLPFDSFMTPNWFIHYIQQAIMGNSAIAIFYLYSGYTLLLMNFSCWEIDALSLQVTKMFHKESDEELEKDQVKKIILRSYRVIDWMKEARWLLRFGFLVDLSMSAFILCLCLYTLRDDIFASIPVLVFVVVAFLQIGVLCWMGNRVNVCVENLTCAIYDVEWYTQKARNRRDLLKILIMAQQLEGFNGIFNSVDFETLLTIWRFTYSLWTLLRTTN